MAKKHKFPLFLDKSVEHYYRTLYERNPYLETPLGVKYKARFEDWVEAHR